MATRNYNRTVRRRSLSHVRIGIFLFHCYTMKCPTHQSMVCRCHSGSRAAVRRSTSSLTSPSVLQLDHSKSGTVLIIVIHDACNSVSHVACHCSITSHRCRGQATVVLGIALQPHRIDSI